MKKIITKDQTIELETNTFNSAILLNDIKNIKLKGNEYIDLYNLNLNIVKYELDNKMPIHIENSNINKLILNRNVRFVIKNSTINDIYIQSEIEGLMFKNANIPNLHGRVDLINKIIIE